MPSDDVQAVPMPERMRGTLPPIRLNLTSALELSLSFKESSAFERSARFMISTNIGKTSLNHPLGMASNRATTTHPSSRGVTLISGSTSTGPPLW